MLVDSLPVTSLKKSSGLRLRHRPFCRALPGIKFALLLPPIVVVIPELLRLAGIWRDYADTVGGILVLPMSAAMVFENRKAIRACPKDHNLWGLLPYALGLSLLLAGQLTGLGLITNLAGAVFLAWGWPCLKTVLFPLAFLLFMWPMPGFLKEAMLPYLQTAAAHIPATALNLLCGLSLVVDGYVVHLPSKAVLVAPACSGLYSLWGSLQVALFLGRIMLQSWKRRLILLLLTITIALFGNLLRIAITILMYHKPELYRYTHGQYHGLLGCGVMFGVLLISLAIAALLERSEPGSKITLTLRPLHR